MLKVHRAKTSLRWFLLVLTLFLFAVNRFCLVAHGEPSSAQLFLDPPMYVADEIGEVFSLAVNISNVQDLCSVQFTLVYNTSLLDIVQVEQGPYFPSYPDSFFEYYANDLLGNVNVIISITETATPRSGNGTLASVEFEAVQSFDLCGSPLNLQETLLLDSASAPIIHDSVGAVYFWDSMRPDPPTEGRFLDLYTQRGGVGLDEWGGEFLCGEEVYLTSLVKYNGSPVQNKLVAYQVRNPLNETTLIRVAETDQDGFAQVVFRIPSISSSNGSWTAFSIVDVAEASAWDTLIFNVYCRVPVGGYSVSTQICSIERISPLHLSISTIVIAVFIMIRRKTHL